MEVHRLNKTWRLGSALSPTVVLASVEALP